MSKENKMGKLKPYDIGMADFSLDKPIEGFNSKQSQKSSSANLSEENKMVRLKSYNIGTADFSLDKPIETFHSKQSQNSSSANTSETNKMGRLKSYNIGAADFSLDKPIETFHSKQSQPSSFTNISAENTMGRLKSYDIGAANFSLDKQIETFHSKQSHTSSFTNMPGENTMGRLKSYDIGAANFSLDKQIETFHSKQSQASSCDVGLGIGCGQRSVQAVAGPSCSSNELLTRHCSWIKEEDNRDEKGSSFSGLDLHTPQLVHPTKARAKRPITRRPVKNGSARTASTEDTTRQFVGLKAQGSSVRGKEPLRNTTTASARTSHTIRDSRKESTSDSRASDNIKNLRARFEQMN